MSVSWATSDAGARRSHPPSRRLASAARGAAGSWACAQAGRTADDVHVRLHLGDARHLPLLHRRDTGEGLQWVEHDYLDVGQAAHRLDGRRAGVARRAHEERELPAALPQEVAQHAPEHGHPKVLERKRGPMPQLSHKHLRVGEPHHLNHVGTTKGVECAQNEGIDVGRSYFDVVVRQE